MIKEVVNITPIRAVSEYQEYSTKDLNLIQEFQINSDFGIPEDYVEFYIYDLNNNLLFNNPNCGSYTLSPKGSIAANSTSTVIELFPDTDVKSFGIDRGTVRIVYNFYRNLLSSSFDNRFWIKEISSNRTELKVACQNISNDDLLTNFANYQAVTTNQPYYSDFLLNFGNNVAPIGVNLLAAVDADEDAIYLVKLYEPLPTSLSVKDTFWFVEKQNEPVAYNVTISVTDEQQIDQTPRLRGPNFNVGLNTKVNQTLQEYSYNDLFGSSISSSYQQIKSLLEEKGVEINVDYSDFNNFIHFSSATDRIYNFRYKVQLIESYSADLSSLSVTTGDTTIINTTSQNIQAKINNLIEKFDDYEYYLYYESASTAWPKRTSTKPYSLYSVTSSQANSWLGLPVQTPQSVLYSASAYDAGNKDLFTNTIPSYLRDDPDNAPYETFLNMVGQYFDNIWVYLKDVTERHNANSSLTKGISKDLVANTLKGLGINLYTNTNISDNLYYSLLGFNPNGSLLPPTGSEKITYYITSSQSTMAAEDITLEYYKRIYHNLPYLLKTKGTERGVRALVSCFGVPDTLLRINEYGGLSKNLEYSGYKIPRFSLAYKNDYTSSIVFPWAPSYYQALRTGDYNLVPDGIEFRFKSTGVPSSSAYYTQSLFQVGLGSNFKFGINLKYDPTTDKPGSPYSNYGTMTFYMGGSLTSSPIHLPFFDSEQWWTVLIKRDNTGASNVWPSATNTYRVFVKSTFFNEEGISRVGFEGSANITTVNNTLWSNYNASENSSLEAYLGGASSNNILSPDNCNFDGYFQEFRYWVDNVSDTSLNNHVLNSSDYSIAEHATGSLFNLIFRAPLGNDLTVPYRTSAGVVVNQKDYDLYLLGKTSIASTAVVESIHPARSGSFFISGSGTYTNIQSFINGSAKYGYGVFSTNNYRSFKPQEFVDLANVPSVGIGQKINNRVIVENTAIGKYPVETTLGSFTSLQDYSRNRTISTPDLEIAYSPADLIDEDIVNQLGGFNIDQYIGSPSDRYTRNYADLDALKHQYFAKYIKTFNLYDFIRLLKYVDNSLFKMLKDFTPARANLSTGIVVKPHILERSKYQRYEPEFTIHSYSSSIDTAFIEGSTPQGLNYNTAYTRSIITPTGSTTVVEPNYLAQYTGEFKGSEIQVVTGEFPQYEVSTATPIDPKGLIPVRESWYYVTMSLDPLFNNITPNRKSIKQYDLDYSTDAILPVNYNVISKSIIDTQGGLADYSNKYIPWAQIQDSNYASKAFTGIRYDGSKTQSQLYSTYSVGDSSYGKTAAIDKIRYQYAYLKDITTASLVLPNRSNAQIKYLVDDTEAVLDLTKENNNIFDIQNIFKGGETVNISLFDYAGASTDLLTNRNITIYEGGFRYSPIYHNLSPLQSSTPVALKWKYVPPFSVEQQASSTTIIPCDGNPTDWSSGANWQITYNIVTPPNAAPYVNVQSITYVGPQGSLPTNCDLLIKVGIPNNVAKTSYCYPTSGTSYFNFVTFVLPRGTAPDSLGRVTTSAKEYGDGTLKCICLPTVNMFNQVSYSSCDSTGLASALRANSISLKSSTAGTTSTPYTYWQTITGADEVQPCLIVPAGGEYAGRIVKFSEEVTKALGTNKDKYALVFDSTSDPAFATSNIEAVSIPFSLATGDGIHIWTAEGGFAEINEYRIVETFESSSIPAPGAQPELRRYAVLNKSIDLKAYTVPATSTTEAKICKYIVAKHLPDETNVILRYTPQNPAQVEEGILYPQYILEAVRKNAGNVIKSLKSQGLI